MTRQRISSGHASRNSAPCGWRAAIARGMNRPTSTAKSESTATVMTTAVTSLKIVGAPTTKLTSAERRGAMNAAAMPA